MAGDGTAGEVFSELGGGQVADADGADFSLVAEFQQRGHGFLDRGFFRFHGGPVDLIEIDAVGGEIAQRALDLDGDGVRPERAVEVLAIELGEKRAAGVVPPEAAFGGEQDGVAAAFDGFGDQALAVAPAVCGCGVQQVDAGVERGGDGAEGFGVVG